LTLGIKRQHQIDLRAKDRSAGGRLTDVPHTRQASGSKMLERIGVRVISQVISRLLRTLLRR
jgi:hypothetical protein